jgi:hypothetical protein
MRSSMTESAVKDASDTGASHDRYARPILDRLGTFRELTQHDDFGFFGGLFQHRPDGCMMSGSTSHGCHSRR